MPRQLGGDSPERLIEVDMKRSFGFGGRRDSNFGQPQRHRSTLFVLRPVTLFNNILHKRQHLLFPLLPPVRDDHYFLRNRSQNLQLPARSSSLKDNNFLMSMLYKDIHSSQT